MRRISNLSRPANPTVQASGAASAPRSCDEYTGGLTPPRSPALIGNRAGFSLLEMFVAVVVFGTVLMTFLPLMQSVGKQQRMTDQRLLALREANNVLEQLSQRKWDELTADELAKLTLPDDVKSRLPQAELQIDVSEPAEQPPSKRVAVKLSWTPRSGQAAQSVQLATWFFQTEGQP